jgi:hypothetical protein
MAGGITWDLRGQQFAVFVFDELEDRAIACDAA